MTLLTRPAAAAVRGAVLAVALAIVMVAALFAASLPAVASARRAPRLSASAAVLIEQSTGRRLYGRHPNARLPIASTTKLMTALITLEHVHRLRRVFAQNNYYPAAVDSQIGLVPGERMSVHDLLIALLLPSADDAAEDLAFNVGRGSIARFIGMMNARARRLALSHTHYATPSGLDTPGNYSSASDLVKLASYVLSHNRFFARVVALPRAVLRTGRHVRVVVNRNDLVARFRWINGVKTGHTSSAGYVLVGSGRRRRMSLVSAVLGTSSESSRDRNTLALLGYGFANFRVATPVRRGQVIIRPTVRHRPGVRTEVIAGGSVRRVVPRASHLTLRVTAPDQLAGPLRRHAVVGQLAVVDGGRVIARVPLQLARALPAASRLTVATRFLMRPITLVLIAALLSAVLGLVAIWRRRARERAAARPETA